MQLLSPPCFGGTKKREKRIYEASELDGEFRPPGDSLLVQCAVRRFLLHDEYTQPVISSHDRHPFAEGNVPCK
jgi:hypothetical protein